MRYEVHVSRWERDAFSVIRHHAVCADEMLRIHVMGGSGTLSEAASATINLPNVQIAAYPMGNENIFLRYFGNNNMHLFASVRSQVLSGTTPIDAVRCGSRYGLFQGIVGFEAVSARDGFSMYEANPFLNQDVAYFLSGVKNVFSKKIGGQEYKINLDGEELSGTYISMLIANGPCYAKNMSPASDAHPNDGMLDVYIVKKISRLTFLMILRKYLSGNHRKITEYVSHYRCKKIAVSSEKVMTLLLDSNPFFEHETDFEILPYAIDLVCPGGIDVEKLPRIFGQKAEGLIP
jgi:diacylglycerol kinase family enzyme